MGYLIFTGFVGALGLFVLWLIQKEKKTKETPTPAQVENTDDIED